MFAKTIDLSTKHGAACNNNCMFCVSLPREGHQNDYMHPQDSETARIKLELLNKLRLEKVKEITFTASGGEPTLRSDILELLSYANEIGYEHIDLESNGRMFCYPEFTKRFIEVGCEYVTIPLHASNAKLHDKITMTPGSFEQTVNGIKNLLTYPDRTRVRIRVLLHKLNYKNLNAIAQFISNEFKGIYEVEFFLVELLGVTLVNRKRLAVQLNVVKPHLEKAIGVLKRDGFSFVLLYIPFCIINRKYWKNVACREVKEGLKTLKPSGPKDCCSCTIFESCNRCVMKEKCPGTWDDYASLFGTSEFKPIISL